MTPCSPTGRTSAASHRSPQPLLNVLPVIVFFSTDSFSGIARLSTCARSRRSPLGASPTAHSPQPAACGAPRTRGPFEAHIPQAARSLWEAVYVKRFGFTRVPGLRGNLDDPDDPDEAHEIPLVVRVGDLRALWYNAASEAGSAPVSRAATTPRNA